MKNKYKILCIENFVTQEYFWNTLHFYVYAKKPNDKTGENY